MAKLKGRVDMSMFVNRKQELAFLNKAIRFERGDRGQMLLLYGRRRIGKTRLLNHWAQQANLPYTYWVAEREPAALQRRRLFARILGADDPMSAPAFSTWSSVWQAAIPIFQSTPQGRILILDELPYAVESEPSLLTSLQHIWDQHLQHMKIAIALCGSHVRTMETLQSNASPLFGRMTGQWQVEPLPFSALKDFFPGWSAEERVALYSIVGGVAAYLDWLNPALSLVENLRQVIFARGSMFSSEPMILLYDEVREPASYLAILKAIGTGRHSLDEISNACLIDKSNLSSYLDRLQDMRLIERRIPATVRPAERSRSRRGRYHMRDPFMRFYFRFVAPFAEQPAFETDAAVNYARQGLRAHVGMTTFEELAREWVRQRGRAGHLPLTPDVVGSHWTRTAQTDVVAIDWVHKHVLVGECKWGTDDVDLKVLRGLQDEKLPTVLKDLPDGGEGWRVTTMLFSRTDATSAAKARLRELGGMVVTLSQLDRELGEA
jgi:AAA+ ATPase superfamily predicted ATPase